MGVRARINAAHTLALRAWLEATGSQNTVLKVGARRIVSQEEALLRILIVHHFLHHGLHQDFEGPGCSKINSHWSKMKQLDLRRRWEAMLGVLRPTWGDME